MRAGRTDLVRAVELLGGFREVSAILGLKVSSLRKQNNPRSGVPLMQQANKRSIMIKQGENRSFHSYGRGSIPLIDEQAGSAKNPIFQKLQIY